LPVRKRVAQAIVRSRESGDTGKTLRKQKLSFARRNGLSLRSPLARAFNLIYVTIMLRKSKSFRQTDEVFRAISDPTRRAILDRLRAGPANAGALAADFQSSRPGISRHLRVLRKARLVTDKAVGRERIYRIDPVPLQSVVGWLEGYRAFWQSSLDQLKRNLEGT
jgi:DNA-binding transcriptional ArsR family regulator